MLARLEISAKDFKRPSPAAQLPKTPGRPIVGAEETERVMGTSDLLKTATVWRVRLQNFRSADFAEAKSLLATEFGREVMGNAVSSYLQDWANSSWEDSHEIEAVAADLGLIWPENAERISLSAGSSRAERLREFFIKVFDKNLRGPGSGRVVRQSDSLHGDPKRKAAAG